MTPTRREDNGAHRNPEAGFSLIEVMSALVILAIAMTAVFATFISQQKSFTVQSRVAEMQQNLRQAVEYMSRDIRLAGYGIPDNVTIPNTLIPSGITSIRSLYAIDNTTGPDQIYILYFFDMDNNQRSTWNTNSMASGAGTVTVDNTDGFLPAPAGELVIVTDFVKAQLFQTVSKTVTALNFGGTIYPGAANGAYATGSPPPAPSTVAKARFVRYYIDNTTDPAHPMLMVDRMGAPRRSRSRTTSRTCSSNTGSIRAHPPTGTSIHGFRTRRLPSWPRSGRYGCDSSRGRASRIRVGRRCGRRLGTIPPERRRTAIAGGPTTS